jgi:hypothetical protein
MTRACSELNSNIHLMVATRCLGYSGFE